MGRFLAAMYAAGATLGVAACVLPHGHGVDTRSVLLLDLCLGYPAAAALYFLADRIPRWFIHVLLVNGVVMTSLGVHFAGAGSPKGASPIFYVWVAVYAAYYFPWPVTTLYIALSGATYAAILVLEPDPAAPGLWVGWVGTTAVTAAVVGSLATRMRKLSATDPLTGLPNRRAWEDALARELPRAGRRGSQLCVAIIDLDQFKALNDVSGHQAGDRLLKEASAGWTERLRDSDVLARYGGDEFGLILPECGLAQACEIVDRLRRSGPTDSTCSAGIAWWQPGESPAALVSRADAALYKAKAQGRDQVVVSTP